MTLQLAKFMRSAHDAEHKRWYREWQSEGMEGRIYRVGDDGAEVLMTKMTRVDLRQIEDTCAEMASDAAWRAAIHAFMKLVLNNV